MAMLLGRHPRLAGCDWGCPSTLAQRPSLRAGDLTWPKPELSARHALSGDTNIWVHMVLR
jgi:hypothetical protein